MFVLRRKGKKEEVEERRTTVQERGEWKEEVKEEKEDWEGRDRM